VKALLLAWHANAVADWSLAALIALSSLLVLIVARHVAQVVVKAVARRRTIAPLSKIPEALIASTRLWLFIPLSMVLGATAVELPANLDRALMSLLVIGLLVQAAFWLNALINLWLTGEIEKRRSTDGEAVTALALMQFAARVLVWTLILLVILNHLNFNISALVTGLGVGGVAVALAVQNVLGDLFASLSIVLDKPFVIGDFIIVDTYMGSVEHIGLKTTRVRSLSGELIVFSNADLLKSRVRNYKRMVERRVAFNVNVAYGTDPAKLDALPGFLRETVSGHDMVRFDSVYFKEMAEWALVFEVVYHVLTADNDLYMGTQQKVNLAIYKYFRDKGIEFAHPMRTLEVSGSLAALPDANSVRRESSNDANRGDHKWTRNATA